MSGLAVLVVGNLNMVFLLPLHEFKQSYHYFCYHSMQFFKVNPLHNRFTVK